MYLFLLVNGHRLPILHFSCSPPSIPDSNPIIPYDNYVIYSCTYVPFVSPFEETSHGYVVTTTFYRTCPRRHLDYHHGQCPTGTSATSMQLEYRRYRRVQYAPAASAQPPYRTR